MIRCDENMPELTDDELLEMAMDDFNAAAADAAADENMPEMTPDELLAFEARMCIGIWNECRRSSAEAAADDAHAERLHPHADPKCPYCHGTGTVYDSVDYGSTTVQMPSTCECVEVDDNGD